MSVAWSARTVRCLPGSIELARKLDHHPDSYASDAVTAALADLASSGVVETPGRRGWRAFRGKLYAPLLQQYGFDPRAGAYAGEDPERTQRRVQIVGRLAGQARQQPDHWLVDARTHWPRGR